MTGGEVQAEEDLRQVMLAAGTADDDSPPLREANVAPRALREARRDSVCIIDEVEGVDDRAGVHLSGTVQASAQLDSRHAHRPARVVECCRKTMLSSGLYERRDGVGERERHEAPRSARETRRGEHGQAGVYDARGVDLGQRASRQAIAPREELRPRGIVERRRAGMLRDEPGPARVIEAQQLQRAAFGRMRTMHSPER